MDTTAKTWYNKGKRPISYNLKREGKKMGLIKFIVITGLLLIDVGIGVFIIWGLMKASLVVAVVSLVLFLAIGEAPLGWIALGAALFTVVKWIALREKRGKKEDR